MMWRSARKRRTLAEEAGALLAQGQSANLAEDYATAVTALERAVQIGRRLCQKTPTTRGTAAARGRCSTRWARP